MAVLSVLTWELFTSVHLALPQFPQAVSSTCQSTGLVCPRSQFSLSVPCSHTIAKSIRSLYFVFQLFVTHMSTYNGLLRVNLIPYNHAKLTPNFQ